MSTLINISPFISKVISDMLNEQGVELDVDSVYARLTAIYGDAIYEASSMFVEIAVRAKIKSHLRTAYSVNGEDDDAQLKLIKEDAPATIAVRQPDGRYVYVPLSTARPEDFRSATAAKVRNIENARAALDKWEGFIEPILAIMETEGVSFLEAQKVAADRAPPPDVAKTA